MTEEVWRHHPEYKFLKVSNMGRVMSNKSGKWVELTSRGKAARYAQVGAGHANPVYVHKLVAQTFIPNPDDLPQVKHINGDTYDNRAENLEWIRRYRRVRIIETGEVYHSRSACAVAIGGISANIDQVIRGKRKTHRGFTFEYVDCSW